MAPYTNAESARPPQTKPTRPALAVPRVIPAVPLAFSRPSRATQLTSIASHEDAAVQPQDPKSDVVVNGSEADTQPDATAGRGTSTSELECRAPAVEEEERIAGSDQGTTAERTYRSNEYMRTYLAIISRCRQVVSRHGLQRA